MALAACGEAHGVRIDPDPADPAAFGQVEDFTFVDQSGAPFGSAQLAGRPWALAAIFTTCAGPCPVIAANFARVQDELEGTGALLVCLSVDPEYDTPAVLSEYAARYGADPQRWRFLTGPLEEVESLVRSSFSLAVDRDPHAPVGQHVTHATKVVAVDRRGRIRGWYSGVEEAGVEALTARLAHLAGER